MISGLHHAICTTKFSPDHANANANANAINLNATTCYDRDSQFQDMRTHGLYVKGSVLDRRPSTLTATSRAMPDPAGTAQYAAV